MFKVAFKRKGIARAALINTIGIEKGDLKQDFKWSFKRRTTKERWKDVGKDIET